MSADTRKAAQAYEAFTGRKPKAVKRNRLSEQDVSGWHMGPVVGIAYEATRDGRRAQYFHEFTKAARPDLVSRDDGRQLYITGGKYTVTDRGIEDMPELFVVNPSPRRAAAKKGRPPMAAAKRKANGQFMKGGRSAAPKRRRKAATRQVAVFRANPAPKRRKRRAVATMGAAPRRRRFKRNPIGGMGLKGLGSLIMPAAGIGGGAVVSEIVMGYLPIPANFKSGILRHITKGAVGIGAGLAISKIFKQKKLGLYVAAGAVVIATHDAIKEFIASRLPMVEQSGFGQYVKPLPSQFGGMGYVNPAASVAFGQYMDPLPSQFAGVSQAYDGAGGETDFRA